ncbi:hypothetical protein HDU83_001946 [Entophlyctis luteolus]|nr:hypothetical protein HDU83_001946 [Entophlyctis luteolus]
MKFTEFRASAEAGQSTALSVRRFAEEAFLPVGFPASVSPDYAEYQIFDSLQAFCSNITGVLATRANFRQIGVGDAAASASAATFSWLLQDGTGMAGRILFAWRVSFFLDADCKQWRFYADILNDAARFIEFAAPVFVSKPWFPVSACLATLLKALCGVTGGSTKAALSQHFAITNNMADLHAKEGSQETVVGMIGMIGGAILLRLVGESDNQLTWFIFVSFTALHLACNYRGISAVVMPSLNTQRAFLVVSDYLGSFESRSSSDICVLTPADVSKRERIFWPYNYCNGSQLKQVPSFGQTSHIFMGAALHQVVDAWSGGVGDKDSDWESLMKTVGSSSPKHIIALDQKSSKFYRILVALSADAVASDILLAYAHGIFLQKKILKIERLPESGDRSWMRDTVAQANKQFFEGAGKPLIQLLEDAGWIVDDGCPSRIHVEGQSRYKLE